MICLVEKRSLDFCGIEGPYSDATTLIRPAFREPGFRRITILNSVMKRRQQIHQALDGKSRQLVVRECRHLRRDS
jgi:hypothetical protein